MQKLKAMSNYFPKVSLTREEIDNRLQHIIDVIGIETVVDNINTMFDVDTAAWFVENLENDYDIYTETPYIM